ncbi:Ig-like domain-containing protein [Paenibacillus sp. GCM10027626]|uniref:Ig-like domain-containing protein n=1 Tax=Paenibacillus sp. GCM10027626 TaxID=3273411 RepID=UPI00362C1871
MIGKSKKMTCLLLALALVLSLGNFPVAHAADNEPAKVNWLAADMDTTFSDGVSPFILENSSSGGTQRIVQINGNNALELRDASLGSNLSSYFYSELKSGRLKDRINEIYSRPIGSSPVDFVLEYKVMRSAASDKPVNKDIYAQLQFGNYDGTMVPRFPAGMPSIVGTSAYKNSEPNVLKVINDQDLPEYKFQIVPNGGARLISSVKLAFSVRVDTGGTDEAYVIDDLAVYELNSDAPLDDEPPTAPADLQVTGVSDTSVKLSWTASTDNVAVTGYTVFKDGAAAAVVGGTATEASIVGLTPKTSYRFTVKARDAAGNVSAASNEVTATTSPSASGLPEPFGNRDIGAVRLTGSASYDEAGGIYKVKGSGADIWGKEDAFHFVYRPWTGDGEIVARVAAMENTVVWSKPGIMIRGGISAEAPYAMMAVTPSNGVIYQNRLQQGGDATQSWGSKSSAPYWLKLVRKGNLITAHESSDGDNWTLIKKDTLTLPETVYVGLAVTSHDNGKLTTADFDHVSVGPITSSGNQHAPFPGTIDTRREWMWNKTKQMSEIDNQLNIAQLVAQIIDNQNVDVNLQKLDQMFKTYDWEQYKTVSKMYAYLMVGDRFSSDLIKHVKDYFASYAYAKLPQTENLRMSNYTAGYLVGQYFPDLKDLNGNSGAPLKAANRANIEEMLEAGVYRGWAEYESPEYTFMTYLCLNALYQYSDEPDFKQKVKMAMDVMWFEWANDWINGAFISTSNRAKGDGVTASDQSWRGADHTALSWIYFGGHRAQEGVGESDSMAPGAYRPYLEYLGMLTYSGMSYTPPELAVRIGQDTNKSYTSRKTNMQNSSGRALKTYRSAYVQPNWGLSTEVTYNRVDNWIEDIPVVVRWLSDSPASVFRLSVDQEDAPIGNYDQPENHRIMQDGKTAVGVFKSLSEPGKNNFINAMFPDTGAIKTREEQSGWVFSDTGPMYFAFKMIKPYSWYYQTPADPSNKVKPNKPHPTKQLHYDYNILRSQADKNGWVLETADASEYADFASFKQAVLNRTSLDSSHIDEANPRLVYTNLSGNVMDINFDLASGSYNNTHKINGKPIDYSAYKLFDTPWLQQEQNAALFTASYGGESLTYNFANWSITRSGSAVAVPNSGFDSGAGDRPDNWIFSGTAASSGHWDSSTFRSPGHAVKIANLDAGDEGRWSLAGDSGIKVDAGSSYTLKAWAKTAKASADGGAYASLAFYKEDGSPASGTPAVSKFAAGTKDWTLLDASIVPPVDAAYLGISLGLKGTGTAWFDDLELTKQAYTAVTGVSITPAVLTLGVGRTVSLNANIEPVEATNRAVTWTSSNPSAAVVDHTGKVTGLAPGTAVIKVTTQDGSFTAEAEVTVIMEPLFADDFSGGLNNWDLFGTTAWQVEGSGSDAVLVGKTTLGSPQRAVAKVSAFPYSSTDYNLQFTAYGDRFRTMFRYSSSTGYYFLEFKNNEEAELWKYANTSTPEQVGTLVHISEAIPGFVLTDPHAYKIEIKGVQFKLFIDDTLVETFQDVSLAAGGIGFSVKSVGPEAKVTISHVLVEPVVTVPAPVKVTGVTLDKTALSLLAGGDSYRLAVKVTPEDAADQSVQWSSSNPEAASVSAEGVVTPHTAGSATITVTTEDGGFTASCEVTVTEEPEPSVSVESVKVDPSSVSLQVGESKALTATVAPANAANKAVAWSTNHPEVATVDETGQVKAVGAGKATITVTTADGGFTASCEVTVTEEPGPSVSVESVKVDPSSVSLQVGESKALKATVAPANAANKAVAWSTDNPEVATVDANGQVKAVGAGKATITVTTMDGGFTASCEVTVTKATEPRPPEYVWYDPQPQTPQPPKGMMVVKPEALKNSLAGVVTIEAADGITKVELPSNAAELLQGSKLLVQSAQATLEVPAKALELAGGAISLTLMPLVDPAAQERIASGQQALGAALRTGSSLYEIGLTAGGKEQAAGFAAPVTLRLKADAALQAGRTGIFWLPAAGKPGYIGGEYGEDGWLMAVIERPGTYAVLEVTKTYSDLPAGHWAYEAVAELSAKQVLQGTSATRFEPGRAVTRAEYAAMLVGALRLTETGEHRFADVPADKWYAEAVAIAYKAGLVTGRSASVFDPEGRITREEMVAMTMKAFSLTGSKGGSAAAQPERVFADETAISAWAKPYVQEAAALQLIQGRAAGKFAPKETAGRAEAAVVICNLTALKVR